MYLDEDNTYTKNKQRKGKGEQIPQWTIQQLWLADMNTSVIFLHKHKNRYSFP